MTRERIRQIEAKGLKKLKKKKIKLRKNILPSLEDVKDTLSSEKFLNSNDFARIIGFDLNTKLTQFFI